MSVQQRILKSNRCCVFSGGAGVRGSQWNRGAKGREGRWSVWLPAHGVSEAEEKKNHNRLHVPVWGREGENNFTGMVADIVADMRERDEAVKVVLLFTGWLRSKGPLTSFVTQDRRTEHQVRACSKETKHMSHTSSFTDLVSF